MIFDDIFDEENKGDGINSYQNLSYPYLFNMAQSLIFLNTYLFIIILFQKQLNFLMKYYALSILLTNLNESSHFRFIVSTHKNSHSPALYL